MIEIEIEELHQSSSQMILEFKSINQSIDRSIDQLRTFHTMIFPALHTFHITATLSFIDIQYKETGTVFTF